MIDGLILSAIKVLNSGIVYLLCHTFLYSKVDELLANLVENIINML